MLSVTLLSPYKNSQCSIAQPLHCWYARTTVIELDILLGQCLMPEKSRKVKCLIFEQIHPLGKMSIFDDSEA